MNVLLYIVTRLVGGLYALMCVDTIIDTAHAAEPTSILAAAGLIALLDVIVVVNSNEQQITAADIVEEQNRREIDALVGELRAHDDES